MDLTPHLTTTQEKPPQEDPTLALRFSHHKQPDIKRHIKNAQRACDM